MKEMSHLGAIIEIAGGVDVVAHEAVPLPRRAVGVVDGEQARAVRRRAVGRPQRLQRCRMQVGVSRWSATWHCSYQHSGAERRCDPQGLQSRLGALRRPQNASCCHDSCMMALDKAALDGS